MTLFEGGSQKNNKTTPKTCSKTIPFIPWEIVSVALQDEPFEDYEDYLIEDILQRSFSDGSLEKQDYALDFDLDELYVFWRDKK